MAPIRAKPTPDRIARWCIWTIRHQHFLAARFRMYVWAATATTLFLAIAGVISFKTAVWAIFCSGLALCALVWLLIERRRNWLLNIREPRLRHMAYQAMLTHIRSHGSYRQPASRQSRPASCGHC